MQYMKNPRGEICKVFIDDPMTEADRATAVEMGYELVCNWDIKDFEQARRWAEQATRNVGKTFLPCDRGESVSPRYSLTEMPTVGMEVSKTINGDYYPCGKVVKVSNSGRRVETDTGVIFWRRRETGCWVAGGCWSMVRGHIQELNPSF